MRCHKLQNIQIALDFLSDKGVSLTISCFISILTKFELVDASFISLMYKVKTNIIPNVPSIF